MTKSRACVFEWRRRFSLRRERVCEGLKGVDQSSRLQSLMSERWERWLKETRVVRHLLARARDSSTAGDSKGHDPSSAWRRSNDLPLELLMSILIIIPFDSFPHQTLIVLFFNWIACISFHVGRCCIIGVQQPFWIPWWISYFYGAQKNELFFMKLLSYVFIKIFLL